MKENSISYKTAKRETERLIVELEERAITHRAFTAECLKRVLKENKELKNKIMEKELEIVGIEEYTKASMGEIIDIIQQTKIVLQSKE